MKEFLIGMDVDGIIADLVSHILGYYNVITNSSLEHKDITQYDMENILGLDNLLNIFHLMEANSGVKDLDLYDGAVELVNDLRKIGRVIFVTAPCSVYKGWSDDRLSWLKDKFDASPKDVISLHDKTLFNGQVLIDDSPKNIDAWIDTRKPAIRVDRPWNQGSKGILANDLYDVFFNVVIIKDWYKNYDEYTCGYKFNLANRSGILIQEE